MDKSHSQSSEETQKTTQNVCRWVSSSELFANDKQIMIQHGANEYLLRITRQDKLILTK